MKSIAICIVVCFASAFPFVSIGQFTGLKSVDSFAVSVGKADSLTIWQLANKLTQPFDNPVHKSRAIYTWIAHNIAYDCKAFHSTSIRKSKPDDVFRLRKAVCAGYSNLFLEMCSHAGLRCLTIDGYARNGAEIIGEKADESNHAWNAVFIDNEWQVVDVTWASGFTDKKVKNFTPQFTETYFFPDQRKFLFSHYPELDLWKPKKSKLSKAEFWKIPTVGKGFLVFDIDDFTPKNGVIKAKTNSSLSFSFKIGAGVSISTIDIVVGEDKSEEFIKPTFQTNNGTVLFSFKVTRPGFFPLTIFVNKVETFRYQLDMEQ